MKKNPNKALHDNTSICEDIYQDWKIRQGDRDAACRRRVMTSLAITVGGKLAQVVKIMGDQVTLQVFVARRVLPPIRGNFPRRTPESLRVSDNPAGCFFNAYGEPIEGGEQIEGEAPRNRRSDGESVRRIQPRRAIATVIAGIDLNNTIHGAGPEDSFLRRSGSAPITP